MLLLTVTVTVNADLMPVRHHLLDKWALASTCASNSHSVFRVTHTFWQKKISEACQEIYGAGNRCCWNGERSTIAILININHCNNNQKLWKFQMQCFTGSTLYNRSTSYHKMWSVFDFKTLLVCVCLWHTLSMSVHVSYLNRAQLKTIQRIHCT